MTMSDTTTVNTETLTPPTPKSGVQKVTVTITVGREQYTIGEIFTLLRKGKFSQAWRATKIQSVNYWEALAYKLSSIHLTKTHINYFFNLYFTNIVSMVESMIALVTLCFWRPVSFSTVMRSRVAAMSHDVHMLNESIRERKQAIKEGKNTPMEEKKEESEDERMKRFIERLQDNTIYDTFGNPIPKNKI